METIGSVVGNVGFFSQIGFTVCFYIKDMFVKGSLNRYVINALATPLQYLSFFMVLGHILRGEALSAIIISLLVLLNYYIWQKNRDDDDFWGNLRKKIGSKLRSMVSSARLVPVPTH